MATAGTDLLSRLGVSLCLAFLLVGCGSEPKARGDGDTAATARVEFVMTRTDKQGRMVMTGSYDYVRKQGVMTAKLVGTEEADSDLPAEVRFFGDRFYSQSEAEGKTYWVVGKEEPVAYPNEAIVPFFDTGIDPKQALEMIMASSKQLEDHREVEVRGVATTHHRVEVDPARLREHLPPGLRLAQGDPSQDRPFAVEVWVDEAERLRRIRIIDELTGGDSVTETYEFFDFGVEVDVGRPPADQVVTDEEFDRLLDIGVGSYTDSGAGEPLSAEDPARPENMESP